MFPIPTMLVFSTFSYSLCFSLFLLSFSGESSVAVAGDLETLSLASLILLGDAHLNNGSVSLTRDLPVPTSGAGKALYSQPVRFRHTGTNISASFSTSFAFSITNLNPSSIGGGLAFVITTEDASIGEAGGFLGLAGGENDTSFVAVEFDTLMDVGFKDVNGNHVGLDLNSMTSSESRDLGAFDIDLKTGNLITAWIDYDGTNRVIYVRASYSNAMPKDPILTADLDLGPYVNDFMYVGFSGSTQGSTETHSIESWSFGSSLDSGLESAPPSPPPLPFLEAAPPPPTVNNSPNQVIESPALSPSNMASHSSETKNTNSSSCHNKLCRNHAGVVAGISTAGAFFLALLAGVLIWVFSKKFKQLKKPSESLTSEFIRMPKEFTYKELKSATKCFNPNRIIGHGAFGTVYKGILPETGDIIAVKRCSHSTQGKTEFLSELSIIGTLRHRNLVRLQGWCHEKGEILLVYDLMPNGSLDKALFEARTPLPWPHRRKILMGVASALAYLHQECENQVIHRDIKTSNIMLDEGFNARLGDFGLARQIEHDKSPDATVAAGTMGYLAPEYLLTGRASEKTDVFSFGAVVLEVASGRRPIEREYTIGCVGKLGLNSNLVEWVWSLHKEGKLLMAADGKLEGGFDEGEMRRVLLVGLACSHPDPLARPTMRGVAQMLMGEAEVPMVPRSKPTLSFSTSHLLLNLQDSVSDCNGMITVSTSSSEHSFVGELV